MKTFVCLCLCIVSLIQKGQTALDACVSGECPSSEANANTCSGGTPDLCVCDINFEPNTDPDTACVDIPCGTNSDCTSPNSYCNTNDSPSKCACKPFFDGVNKATCEPIQCTNDHDCFNAGHAYCDTTQSPSACSCGFMTTIDADTGACNAKSCTDANKDTTCGTSALCVSAKCACPANMVSEASDCVERTCSSHSHCSSADSNSYCDDTSTPNVCKCKTTFDGANKATCDIITCSNDYDCTATSSYCNADSTDSITDGCNCGKMTTADSSTGACAIKSCTDANKDTECGTSALCVSGKCACPANMISGAAGCIEKTCSTNSHCTEKGGDTNLECKSSKCACKDGYEVSNTTCVESTNSGSVTASFSVHLFLLTLGLYRVAKMLE